MTAKNYKIEDLGKSIQSIAYNFLKLNLFALILLIINSVFNIEMPFVITDFLLSIMNLGFVFCIIFNCIMFGFVYYTGGVLLDLSSTISNIDVPKSTEIKINYRNLRSILSHSDELLSIKDNATIVATIINPLFLTSLIICGAMSFVYIFISFLILIF